MLSFKENSRLYALACKNSLTIFVYILQFSMEIMSSRSQHAGGKGKKVVQRRWNWLGQFTNNRLRATTATRGLQEGIPEKFVIERAGHRYVRSLQKYQRPDTSSQIEISKKFNCCEAVSLPEWVTSERGVNKTWSRGRRGRSERLFKISEGKLERLLLLIINCTLLVSKDFNSL